MRECDLLLQSNDLDEMMMMMMILMIDDDDGEMM